MRSSDGGIWRLRWWQEGEWYFGEVVGHPRVCAKGATFETMATVLADEVGDKLQAGEWTADWDPPPPPNEDDDVVGHSLRTHVLLQGEGRFVAMMAPGDVYASFCKACGTPTGPRTDKPLQVWIESTANLCFDFGSAPGDISIYSIELADLLINAPGASDVIDFRPCKRLGRGRKQFCEVVLRSGNGLPRPQPMKTRRDYSSTCHVCGHAYNYAPVTGNQPTHYYLKSDLPSTDGLFCLSPRAGAIDVCVPIGWWRAHKNLLACRGVASTGIGVADEGKIDRGGKRRPVTELATFNRHLKDWKSRQTSSAKASGLPPPTWA